MPWQFLALTVCVMAISLPEPANAGTLAAGFDVGLRTMSNAVDTERAIFGAKRGHGVGLSATYDFGARWRFGLEWRLVNRDGERAFAADRTSEAFRLGHPLTLAMSQGLVSVVFRFRKTGPVSPYLGVGGGVVSWREESNTAGLIDNANGTSGLIEGRLGLERQQGPLRMALEGGITFAPNAVGTGGISKLYEESDLGGLFLVLKIGVMGR